MYSRFWKEGCSGINDIQSIMWNYFDERELNFGVVDQLFMWRRWCVYYSSVIFVSSQKHPVGLLLLLSPSQGDGKYGNISSFCVTSQPADVRVTTRAYRWILFKSHFLTPYLPNHLMEDVMEADYGAWAMCDLQYTFKLSYIYLI